MTNKSLSITSLITLSLVLAQPSVKAGGSTAAAKETQETLRDIQLSAAIVEDEADQLRGIDAGAKHSPEWHLEKLEAMKEEVNKMGREMSSLEAERESLAPWEQQAIDKALPLLKDTATNTAAAIRYFNDNRTHLWTEDYRGYADRVWQDSEQIAKTLKNYLKYAKVQDQEAHLKQSLGVEAN